MGCNKKDGVMGNQKETQIYKLDDDIIEIIIFNILSLIIVNDELDKKNFKNKIIDSIIINNINFILNNFYMFSFNNIQKLLFIIDMILNNEVIYYKFNKIIDISTLEWNNFSITTKNSNIGNNADTNLINRERGNIATNKSNMSNNISNHKNEKKNEKKNEDKNKKYITGKQYTYITDGYNINNVNNYIDDIFIYIEEKNTYLSIFHLNYIFKDNKEYENYFKKKYENYLSFGKYYHNITKLCKKKYQENTPLYIKKSKYIELYKSLIKYHISNYNLIDKNDKDYEQIISTLYEKEYTSSSECYDDFDEKTNKAHKKSICKNSMKYTKYAHCGYTIKSSSNIHSCNKTNYETTNCIDEKYIVYNIMNEEKIKKLYKYKTKKYKLMINNNFINKQSYISINIFPCNDIHIYNIKFQTLSTNVFIKSHLLILYTNMILFFNLLNSSLYLWVYKFISFLINILNNFNNTLYIYLDNSKILSQYNNNSHLKLDKKNMYTKYITSINNLENIKTDSLKKIVQKYSKEDNKINFNFPSDNYGYIQTYDKDKKGNTKKFVFHHFVQMQIFKYYAILCLIEIENFYQGILSCLLGDVYNKTIGKIGKFSIKDNYYDTFFIRNKHEKTTNESNFTNNNIDLYLLIIETKNIMYNNNIKSEGQIVNVLTHLYFLILFNYINILVQYSIIDNMFIQNENNFKATNNINEAVSNNSGNHFVKDKYESNEKEKNDVYICNNNELYHIKNEIIELIDKKNVKLELLEFRKSEYIIEKPSEKMSFNGSLITLPFYTNFNLLNYDFYYKNSLDPSSNNPNDVRNCVHIQSNEIRNENADIQICQKDKKKEETIIYNSINSLSPIFVNLVKEKIQNIFNQNFDLIFHYNIYLPFYITTFGDILKKYNYFLFENNSYYFCLGLSYLYISYDQISTEIINEMCKKVLLVIKNNYYTDISKIIIINVFISFLNKKDVLNFCEQNINSYFPTLYDSKDLIITKYNFLLKLIRKKNISLNLLDIYIHLCTHKNSEATKVSSQQLTLLTENIQFCTDLLSIINPQTNSCDNEGLILLNTESDDSCNHSITDFPIFSLSNFDTQNCSKLEKCTLNKKVKNNSKHKYGKENTKFEINFGERWNVNFSHYSYGIESGDMSNFTGIKRKIPKKNKRTNFSNIFGSCNEINENNLSDTSQNEKNVNMKKKYFLIFSYYIVKHYKRNTTVMNMLKSLVLNILLFNPDEINLLFFILYYLYKKKDIELFSFMENVILNCLSHLFNKKYKIIEFSVFLYYLVKIKHSNTIHILNMLSDVLKKYKFPIKVYIIIIKIIKVILQYHNINYNYKYLLSILEIIQNIQNNAYLYRVSTYYINVIENKIAFLERDYFKIQKNNLTNLTLEYDINKNNNISQINTFPIKKNNIPEKHTKTYVLSGYIKLIHYKYDRKNILNLYDNGSTIFYSQQNAPNIINNNKINSNMFSLEKYYNCNDFNSEFFYRIYKDKEYNLEKYINYITKNDHYIYLPLSLIYAPKYKKKFIKNCIDTNNSKIKNKTISRHDLTHIKKKYKIEYKDKKLYSLNICFIHKPHFISMHNVYIPYIEFGDDINEHNNRKFRKQNKKKCHIKGCNKGVSLLKIPNKRINFTLQKRKKKFFFVYSKYSYMLCKSITHEMNCSILNNVKNNGRRKKQNIFPNRQNATCIEKGNQLLQETQSTKNRQISEIIQKITKIYSKNFVNLKKDLVKKEIYKRKWYLKKYLLRLKKVYHIKKKSCKEEKSKKKIMNRYKLLIKIGVKLLINTTFYAYIIYLNKKKTFKKFLGEYDLKFTDFFLPFKAPTIYWKNIFENIWNGKFEKMYKTAKYFNITSDHALDVVNKKLYPFLIMDQPNIKNTKIYNKHKYHMHVEKSYALNDTYYAYNKKKTNRQIKRDIFDEFYIDNYSLNSSDTNFKSNKSNKYHFKNSDLNARRRKHKEKKRFNLYKPILLYNTFYPGLNHLCNKTKEKEKEIVNPDKKLNNVIKIINKVKIHNNIYSLLKNRKKKVFNFLINDDNEIIMDKNIQRNINKKNKSTKENTNNRAINKFAGIFLPPKHHLLMVFQIYDKSTIVKIRTDNLNVLNYLDPFLDECNYYPYIQTKDKHMSICTCE
ncbi:conserved Plasmodium protein, unknown function [Plasmodium vinckei lentum]|uniref:AP5B1 C-terminal domain-containing protein n=1 Tax=Plasmodium vinckei lentum TaxID=138297 RepID=A0A6V7SYX0_PLAVN|nr:conserved Plasmodium protein, unknown function [Plasmodium vinckei lentum]